MLNKIDRKTRRDLIVISTVAVVASLYLLGMPRELIVDLVMVCLLLAAIAYVLIYPIIEGYRDIRDYREFQRIKKLKQSSDLIDTMTWKEFEIFVGQWLVKQGFEDVRLTEHYDLGVDITAKKNGESWGVQVKHYHNMVKIEAIRQVVVALKHYKCDRSMVVTNSFFSRPAKQLALSQQCILVDGNQLRSNKVYL